MFNSSRSAVVDTGEELWCPDMMFTSEGTTVQSESRTETGDWKDPRPPPKPTPPMTIGNIIILT